MLSQIRLGQLLALMDESVRNRVVTLARKAGTTHLVFFENTVLDSSRLGDSSVVAIGPGNTYKTLADVEGKWLHDLPSRRQYPQYWCQAKESETHTANWCPVCRCRVHDGWCTPGYRGVHIQRWMYRDPLPPILGGERRPQKTERRH